MIKLLTLIDLLIGKVELIQWWSLISPGTLCFHLSRRTPPCCIHTHKHAHTHTHIYIYILVQVIVHRQPWRNEEGPTHYTLTRFALQHRCEIINKNERKKGRKQEILARRGKIQHKKKKNRKCCPLCIVCFVGNRRMNALDWSRLSHADCEVDSQVVDSFLLTTKNTTKLLRINYYIY